MSDSTAAALNPPAPTHTSFWEDVIDIFVHPAAVFERRRNASAWPPFLFVVIVFALVTFGTFSAIQPAFDGDYARNIPKMMAQNPQMTQEMADKGAQFQAIGVHYFSGVFVAVTLLIVGFFTWLLGKFFGSRATFGAAMLITSYAYMPRLIGSIAAGVQGLLMDSSRITSMSSLSLSAARFLDPDKTSPIIMALLGRLDLTVIWETILLAVGVAVIGRVSVGKAIAFGVTIWIVGSLYLLRAAYLIS
jgi:hypothetical protein